MEFGHVYDSLEAVNFVLPDDSDRSLQTLKAAKNNNELKVYVGAAKWGVKQWRGTLYSPTAAEGNFLTLYARNFNTVEFGPTFYTLQQIDYIKGWADKVHDTPGFKFLPRFPQHITHIRRLMHADDYTKEFYASLAGFGGHAGPLHLQLGDNFSPKSFLQLKAYLEQLPETYQVAVEVRNKDWFAAEQHRLELFELFKRLGMIWVITDTAGRRDCAHMELPTPHTVVRFVGNRPDQSDYRRLDEWVDRFAKWKELGLQSIWFFIHQHDEKFTPMMCDYFIEKLNLKLGTTIKRPAFSDNRLGL